MESATGIVSAFTLLPIELREEDSARAMLSSLTNVLVRRIERIIKLI